MKKLIKKSKNVFDIKVSKDKTKIEEFALRNNIKIFRGIEMYKYQFKMQFYLYTKINISMKKIDNIFKMI